jgi:hypothetical protein
MRQAFYPYGSTYPEFSGYYVQLGIREQYCKKGTTSFLSNDVSSNDAWSKSQNVVFLTMLSSDDFHSSKTKLT